MFSQIRRRLTYANVAMTLALVFAMSGGAYAAKRYVITSTKQISPSVLKQLKGSNGKSGPAGPTGPAGPAGPTGPAGSVGKDGASGKDGTNGTNGESVVSAQLPVGNSTCSEGGSEFTVGATHTHACTGSPWPAGGTLPAGKSETGAWSIVYQASAAGQPGSSAISFTIPLKAAPEAHYIGTKEELAGEPKESPAIKEGKCKGNPEEPEAASGNLCVFAKEEANATEYLVFKTIPVRFFAVGTGGTVMPVASVASGEVLALGTWAVTG